MAIYIATVDGILLIDNNSISRQSLQEFVFERFVPPDPEQLFRLAKKYFIRQAKYYIDKHNRKVASEQQIKDSQWFTYRVGSSNFLVVER